MQRRQAETPHLSENDISLSATVVCLIGIMAIDNATAVKQERITAPVASIEEAHADEPIPSFNRAHPTRSRYFELFIGWIVFERGLEVIGDNVLI